MELYNFFTIPKSDRHDLNKALLSLKDCCHFVHMVEKNGEYSIIGQIYGDDTNMGDLDLLLILSDIPHVWFDARMPTINSIKTSKL